MGFLMLPRQKNKLKITKVFFVLFLVQVFLLAISTLYDTKVIWVGYMVAYLGIMVVIGSFCGEVILPKQKLPGFTINLKKALGLVLLCFVSGLIVKFYLFGNQADYTSYTAFRVSFLLKSFGINGIVIQFFLWLALILAGSLSYQVFISNKEYLQKTTYLLIFLTLVFALFSTGSRGSILLYITAFMASVKSWTKIFKAKKLILGFVLIVISALVILGIVRGVSLNHILTPFDSFIVGPHLLNHNIEIIEGQKQYLNSRYSSPPGYSLFSGFYVFLNVLLDFFGVEVFKHHLEVVFWKRHAFDYLPAFDNKYNSYYTGALAVVIEGWLTTGLLSFLIGLLPHFIRFKILKTIALSCGYLFALSLFRNSIFHNTSMAIIFVFTVLLGLLSKIANTLISRSL